MNNCVLVWRRSGEEWTPPCLNPGRSFRVSLMIWGCITKTYMYEGVGTLTVVDSNINAQKYIEVIDNFVWPLLHVISQMTIMCFKMIMPPCIGHG